MSSVVTMPHLAYILLLTLVTLTCEDKLRMVEIIEASTIKTAEDSRNKSVDSVAAHILREASTMRNGTEHSTNGSNTKSKLILATIGDSEDTRGTIRKEIKTILTTISPKSAEDPTNMSNDSSTTRTLRSTDSTYGNSSANTLVPATVVPTTRLLRSNVTEDKSTNTSSSSITLVPATVVPILIIGLILLFLVTKVKIRSSLN